MVDQQDAARCETLLRGGPVNLLGEDLDQIGLALRQRAERSRNPDLERAEILLQGCNPVRDKIPDRPARAEKERKDQKTPCALGQTATQKGLEGVGGSVVQCARRDSVRVQQRDGVDCLAETLGETARDPSQT